MGSIERVLASEKRQRFFGCIRQTYGLSEAHLIEIVRATQAYSVRMRLAALWNLTAQAPLEVTKGRPFAERRRLVRAHYNV